MDSERNEQSSIPSASTSPLSDMLSTLLSNPALMETLKGAIQAPPQQELSEKAESGSGSDGASVGTVGNAFSTDGLATVLSNPELMAKLPQMMTMLRPMLEGGLGDKSSLPPTTTQKKSSEACRNELLCALKPFLSPERRNAVDAMLRISQLGSVLKHIK